MKHKHCTIHFYYESGDEIGNEGFYYCTWMEVQDHGEERVRQLESQLQCTGITYRVHVQGMYVNDLGI